MIKKTKKNTRILRLKVVGEVNRLTVEAGASCGRVKSGVRLEFPEYSTEHCHFERRAGILTKKQAIKLIEFLENHLGDYEK